jgi:hypothetical protein
MRRPAPVKPFFLVVPFDPAVVQRGESGLWIYGYVQRKRQRPYRALSEVSAHLDHLVPFIVF